MIDFNFEEVKLKCINCSKLVTLVIYPYFGTEDYLCPKCSFGESYFEAEGDN